MTEDKGHEGSVPDQGPMTSAASDLMPRGRRLAVDGGSDGVSLDCAAQVARALAHDQAEERAHRIATIDAVFAEGDWLTAAQVNALQAIPPGDELEPAEEWKRSGRVFSVNYVGQEYFGRFQFDALYQPSPIIKEIIAAFGEVDDTWTLAVWFHCPSAWLVQPEAGGATNIAPKDALDRASEVLSAAVNRLGSYVA